MYHQKLDTARHRRNRQRLVEEVRSKGIHNEDVLAAIAAIPRHFFVSASREELAYLDQPVPIGEGQTISQPYTVAYQTELLNVCLADKILEIGTGSAYQACVLSELGAQVYTIERQKRLFEKYQVSSYLQQCRNVHFFYGDGHEGLPEYAPFDKILITAATAEIPRVLIDQLKHGGQLVAPLGTQDQSQMMLRITKEKDGTLTHEAFNQFRFVPMLEGTTG